MGFVPYVGQHPFHPASKLTVEQPGELNATHPQEWSREASEPPPEVSRLPLGVLSKWQRGIEYEGSLTGQECVPAGLRRGNGNDKLMLTKTSEE